MYQNTKKIILARTQTAQSANEKKIKDTLIRRITAAGIKLPNQQVHAIADFVAVFPKIVCQSDGGDACRKGFFRTGIVSEDDSAPDLKRLLALGERTLTPDEVALSVKSLPQLIKYQTDHAEVPDEIYRQLGFKLDQNPESGETNVITTTTPMRSKRGLLLTHEAVRKSNTNRVKAMNDKKRAAIEKDRANICGTLKKAAEARVALQKNCPNLAAAEYGHFNELNRELLRAFIVARGEKAPSKKGSVSDAASGVNNLIKVAYDVRE